MDFILVINQIIILFLLLILGYVIRRLDIIDDHVVKKLSGFLLKVTLPALIISSMQIKEFSRSIIKDSVYLIIISFCTYLIAILLAIVIPRVLKVSKDQVGLYQFLLVFANVGFIGYPLVEVILGKEAIFYAAIYNLSFNILVYTLGFYYMAKGKEDERFTLKKIINPGLVAVIIGFTLFIFSIKLPKVLSDTINIVGGLTTPISMILVGGLLINAKLKDLFANFRLYVVSFYRMLLFPVVVFGLLNLIFKDYNNDYIIAIPVIISALPVAINAAILAEQYDVYPEIASNSIFISTLLSMLTIPIISYLLFL